MRYIAYVGNAEPPLGPPEWYEIDFVTTSDAVANDALGERQHSICLSRDGSLAVVGCRADDSNRGAAYVFQRTGDVWAQVAKLVASDGAANDEFGWSVAISGDGSTIAVGAPGDNTSSGSVYIFVGSGGSWTQQARRAFFGSIDAGNRRHGYSVALSENGNTLAAGAPHNGSISTNTGSVCTHLRTGTTWANQTNLVPPSSTAGQCGRSVALSSNGNYLVAGCPNFTGGGKGVSWSRSGSTWTFDEAITRSGSFTQLGTAAALDDAGTTLVLGAATGGAAVWTYSGGAWSHQATLVSATSAAMSGDGAQVALTGIGGDTDIYALISGAWTFSQSLLPVAAASVWMAKDAEHMGATDPTDDTAASNAGAAYFYRYGPH